MVMFACVVWFTAHKAQAFYNPSTGRWLSRDPIGEEGGGNLYGAIENDPVNSIDPLGESTFNIPAGKKDGVELTIQIVTDDNTCQVVGINMLRKGGVDVYVWKYNVSGDVTYQVNCSFYNTSGAVPFNFVYVKNPAPAWVKRKFAKTEPIKESGAKEIPLCCSCKLNVTWNVSGQITVVPGTIEDPTPPKKPKK